MIPGEILFADEPVAFNEGREAVRLTVLNTADRPVQVGSHYHFAEANPGLEFDRAAAHGRRLDIAAGTAVRFEPGIPVDVRLIPSRAPVSSSDCAARPEVPSMPELSRTAYADLFGPTTGDRVRLADTDLFVEIEEDRSGGRAAPATKPSSAAARCCASPWGRGAPPVPRVLPTP